MLDISNLAIIGSGPTATYLLNHIRGNIKIFRHWVKNISIFEKEGFSGMGMPYNPTMTDIHNLANISSEEIPDLLTTFGEWLRSQEIEALKAFNIDSGSIDDREVYPRIALGHYFRVQYLSILDCLEQNGIKTIGYDSTEIVDIQKIGENQYEIRDISGGRYAFSAVVIANGHSWKEIDKPEVGYYASPWPMHKLLPQTGERYNYTIGTLGASLSAFDVVTSLSHRHGNFVREGKSLRFIKDKEAANFNIVLHSAEGWLPHLQYEQVEPKREIYRHFNSSQLIDTLDENGFLLLHNYFDVLCRGPLISAFNKDREPEIVDKLKDKSFGINDFIDSMSDRHQYINSFEGMKEEMVGARQSIENDSPIHWMETLDDLMYSLNYHAELMPAEGHLFFRNKIMPFLMNVIAALPLRSAEILLALYDAGCIAMEKGIVSVDEKTSDSGRTKITVTSSNGAVKYFDYKMFIECAGQKNLEIDEYPFPTLVRDGTVRGSVSQFYDYKKSKSDFKDLDRKRVKFIEGKAFLRLPGIDIDSAYRTIGQNEMPNDGLFDINFIHSSGLRPYSYGLQACNATSLIVVESWILELEGGKDVGTDIEQATTLYENTDEL